MRKSKRVLFKPKVFGFNPYADQIPAIKQIMEENGQQSEAPILRMLIDEALQARRRKVGGIQLPEQPPPTQELMESLQTVQVLMLKVIGQGQTAFRIEGANLELLQETLAEARAGRMGVWESLVKPSLREKGTSDEKISNLFDQQTAEGRDYAYGLAEEIGNEIIASETDSRQAAVDDEDRQESLLLDDGYLSDDGPAELP
ncbi:MAG: hypothetical protein ACREA9_00355 [Pyrinomonadaceae bacterium]